MKKVYSLKILKNRFPCLEKFCRSKLNRKTFEVFRLFVDDADMLTACIIQNPFGQTENVEEIRKCFNLKIAGHINCLNRLHSNDPGFLKKIPRCKEIVMLYLLNFHFILDQPSRKIPDRKKIDYAMKLLERMDVAEIRLMLEDKFFAVLYPEIFQSYDFLLKFTRKKLLKIQREIRFDFEKLLEENKIKAQIQMRLKTIASIHKKIIRKDILFSQVLDTIGLRIVVDREEDCYRSMVLILKNNSVLTHRIKDYIATPKENGYQSIHLTIIYDNHPVEIQIRTWDMHWKAQYGEASHVEYKKMK